ncbi:MAG: mobile mystery protein A [Thermodesulfobacteriota bacterium]
MDKKKLIREQLDVSLERFSPLRNAVAPPKGWIRAIRGALGMTARQLAERLGVAQQAVARIEKEELSGSVTIKTMRRIADSLDCVFVYGFVPRTSLEETVARQAQRVAIKRLSKASQTMRLEKQALSRKENARVLSALADELIRTLPATLWDDHND